MKETITKIYKLDLTISFASLLVAFVVASMVKLHVVVDMPVLVFCFLCFVVYVSFKQVLYVYFKKELTDNSVQISKEFEQVTKNLLESMSKVNKDGEDK